MCGMYQRYQRVSSLIRKELNNIILKEVEFPLGVLVTITDVDVQKDLDYAVVNVSIFPSGKNQEVLKILVRNQRRLQHLLLLKINIRPMPEIRFRLDEGLEKAAEIEKKLLEIEKGNQ